MYHFIGLYHLYAVYCVSVAYVPVLLVCMYLTDHCMSNHMILYKFV
jgi:hypothetical protein